MECGELDRSSSEPCMRRGPIWRGSNEGMAQLDCTVLGESTTLIPHQQGIIQIVKGTTERKGVQQSQPETECDERKFFSCTVVGSDISTVKDLPVRVTELDQEEIVYC